MLGGRLATNLIFNLVIAIWIWHDARRRRAAKPLFAAVLGLLWGPFGMAFWAAERPLVAGERRSGGTPWIMARTFALAWTALAPALFLLVLPAVEERSAVPGSLGRTAGVIPAALIVTLGFWALPTTLALLVGRALRSPEVRTGTTPAPAARIPMGAALVLAGTVAFGFALGLNR